MSVNTPRQLYKHLLRCIKQLPEESQSYYRNYVRQGYISHSDETDPERVKQIISRALEDVKWILDKYNKK